MLDFLGSSKLRLERDKKLLEKALSNKSTIAFEIPKGWFVFEMGQNLVHMLWFCNMLESFPPTGQERKQVFVEEYDTPEEALKAAIKAIKGTE